MDRVGKVKGAIYLNKQVIENVQMQAIGGMMAAKEIWEKSNSAKPIKWSRHLD